MISVFLSLCVLISGVILSFSSGFVQIFRLSDGIKGMFFPDKSSSGEILPFGALCTNLAATLGTGNIIGVSVAVSSGGPGALFWMVVSAFFGMAVSYAEGVLGVKFRKADKKGRVCIGPFCYMEKAFGKRRNVFSKAYALFGMLSGIMGIGTVVQVSSAVSAVNDFFATGLNCNIPLVYGRYPLSGVVTGFVITIFCGLVIVGGAKRISSFSVCVVPVMSFVYIFFVLWVIFRYIGYLPRGLCLVIKGAFCPEAVTGGVVGSIWTSFATGVSKGVFSNEAGIGTGAISASCAMTDKAHRQGCVSMIATFTDTVIMCSLTGLAIVVTGAWQWEGVLPGMATSCAIIKGLPIAPVVTSLILTLGIVLFAFTSIVGWFFYSEKCLEYLFEGSYIAKNIYRILYVSAVFFGVFFTSEFAWNCADLFNTLMVIPNLSALILLKKYIIADCKK